MTPITITSITIRPITMTPLLHASRTHLPRPTTLQHHPRHAQNPNPLPTNPTPAASRLERLDNKTGTPPPRTTTHGRAASLAADIAQPPPRPRPEPAAAPERDGEWAHTGSPRRAGPRTPQVPERPNAHTPSTGPTPNACHRKRQAPSPDTRGAGPNRPGRSRPAVVSTARHRLRPASLAAASAPEHLPRPAPGQHGPVNRPTGPGAPQRPSRHSTHATPRRLK